MSSIVKSGASYLSFDYLRIRGKMHPNTLFEISQSLDNIKTFNLSYISWLNNISREVIYHQEHIIHMPYTTFGQFSFSGINRCRLFKICTSSNTTYHMFSQAGCKFLTADQYNNWTVMDKDYAKVAIYCVGLKKLNIPHRGFINLQDIKWISVSSYHSEFLVFR